ncbi:MAG TPA: adenosine deaminase [Candidatus Dormibacteraeota bacterium]|nr:adenosine deaminase [Candidatus Dormibacteraeota bacterium]
MPKRDSDELIDLHTHLGGAVDPAIMWTIAHEQGIRLPTKDYWEFVDLITIQPGERKSFEQFLALYHWTELIQSSPIAVETSVHEVIGGAYRKNNITTLELRFNPMKRNRGGERDLDHIMMAAIRGLDRVHLEYPVRSGLILCLDREFSYQQNEIIVDKALRYRERGIVGIDIAGARGAEFRYADYTALFKRAKTGGLGITVHAGEEEGSDSVDEVLRCLDPDRIGHGIHAAEDRALCRRLAERQVHLEICPTSNLHTQVVKNVAELRDILSVFRREHVRFSFNTDGPEMLQTTLRGELKFAVRNELVSREELAQCGEWARQASFVRNGRFA